MADVNLTFEKSAREDLNFADPGTTTRQTFSRIGTVTNPVTRDRIDATDLPIRQAALQTGGGTPFRTLTGAAQQMQRAVE